MKKYNKILILILLTLVLSITNIKSINASEPAIKTKEEALEWLQQENLNKLSFDLNGVCGVQCVEFVSGYVNWLVTGNYKNKVYNVGHAKDIPNLSIWSQKGWEVIENTKDFIPEPGDIFVSKGVKSEDDVYYGHTGVVIESTVNTAVIAEANRTHQGWDSSKQCYIGDPPVVHKVSWNSDYLTPKYFIRPIFAGEKIKPISYEEVTGKYYIKNSSNNKYLTVANNSDTDKANILVTTTKSDNQIFVMTKVGDKTSKIVPSYGTKLVNAWGNNPSSGSNVNLYHYDEKYSNSQFWKFEKSGSGYIIHSVYNENLVLSIDEKDNVIVQSKNGSKNQIWYLEKNELTYDVTKTTISGIENKYYTGKNITLNITIKDGTKTLKNGTDYTISYKNNKNVGTATIIIKGKGKYKGSITKTFKISAQSIDKFTVTGISNKIYSGKNITQKISVKNGSTTLKNGTDYTVTYKNNKKVGTATITIQGKGNYTGTITKTFKIRYDFKKTKISGISNKTYNGKNITQKIIVKDGKTTLKEGTDYIVTYKNNKKVGKATITITGKGNYSGTITKTFKINSKSIKKFTVTGISNKKYTGKNITQKVTVKDGKTTLKEGTDYTVSYKNNKKKGKATVTIKGKGNYSGTITKTFKIS